MLLNRIPRAVLAVLVLGVFAGMTLAQEPPVIVKVKPGQNVIIQGVPADEPGPGPGPGPGSPVARFVVFEDTSKTDQLGGGGQIRGRLIASPEVQNYVRASKLSWRLVDVNSAAAAPDVATQFAEIAGRPLPLLFLVDSQGKTIRSVPCPTASPAAFIAELKAGGGVGPVKFALGNLKPDAPLKGSWLKVGEKVGANIPIRSIPMEQWVETSLESFLPPVRNQGSVGKCNAVATANAFMTARAIAGLSFQDLSDDWLYSNICFRDRFGRRIDSGSLLEDGLAWMCKNGTCTRSIVTDGNWNPSNGYPAAAAIEAKEFTVDEAYLCENAGHIASSIQQGFPVVLGIDWYNNFFNPGADGWLPARGDTPAGGHAIVGYALVKRGNEWGIKCRNSWGPTWGQNGNFVIPLQHFNGRVGGFWAIRSVKQTRPVSPLAVRPVDPVGGLGDSVKWVRILAGIRSAVNSKDFAKILNYAEEIATLVGYGSVGKDVEEIAAAVAAKDWAAVVPPLVDLIQFAMKKFAGSGASASESGGLEPTLDAAETIATLKRSAAVVPPRPAATTPKATPVPVEIPPAGFQWHKAGGLDSPEPWKLEAIPVPAPQAMPMPATQPRPILQLIQGWTQPAPTCRNGNCQIAQ